jgi:hypothetical protein
MIQVYLIHGLDISRIDNLIILIPCLLILALLFVLVVLNIKMYWKIKKIEK